MSTGDDFLSRLGKTCGGLAERIDRVQSVLRSQKKPIDGSSRNSGVKSTLSLDKFFKYRQNMNKEFQQAEDERHRIETWKKDEIVNPASDDSVYLNRIKK